MVQTHDEDRPRGELRNKPQHYWKLHTSKEIQAWAYRVRLQSTGLHIPRRIPKKMRLRLPTIDSRAQRGMLLYEKCSYPELRTFCEQRGVDTGTGRIFKFDLIQRLEAADEDVVFPFVEKLAPELRLRIYAFSFQFFRHDTLPENGAHYADLHAPRTVQAHQKAYDVFRLPPPPISRVCRLLRQEALPFFYEKATLTFHVDALPAAIFVGGTVQKYRRHLDFRVQNDGKFLFTAPPELLRLVENISLTIIHIPAHDSAVVEAVLGKDGALKEVKISPVTITMDEPQDEPQNEALKRLKRLLSTSRASFFEDVIDKSISRVLPNDWVVGLRDSLQDSSESPLKQ